MAKTATEKAEPQPEAAAEAEPEAEFSETDFIVSALSIGWDAVDEFIRERAINGITTTERLANATRIAASLLSGGEQL